MIKFVTIRDYWVSVIRHTVGCDFVASIEKFVDQLIVGLVVGYVKIKSYRCHILICSDIINLLINLLQRYNTIRIGSCPKYSPVREIHPIGHSIVESEKYHLRNLFRLQTHWRSCAHSQTIWQNACCAETIFQSHI